MILLICLVSLLLQPLLFLHLSSLSPLFLRLPLPLQFLVGLAVAQAVALGVVLAVVWPMLLLLRPRMPQPRLPVVVLLRQVTLLLRQRL
jgi:hypothetical protein